MPGTICKPKTSENILIKYVYFYGMSTVLIFLGSCWGEEETGNKEWKDETMNNFYWKEIIPESTAVSQTFYLVQTLSSSSSLELV